jgi:hypothetical protein
MLNESEGLYIIVVRRAISMMLYGKRDCPNLNTATSNVYAYLQSICAVSAFCNSNQKAKKARVR